MSTRNRLRRGAVACMAFAAMTAALAQQGPALVWITNSSVKLEQVNGDVDWQALAHGTNLPTVSRTVTRFHILANGLGYSFEDNGKLIFLFGDTISENVSNWNYHAADPLAWSASTDGESGLLLNFYTNNPITNSLTQFTPLFVQPPGIKMGADAVPNSGITLSNEVFLVCNTGSDTGNTNNPHAGDYSVLVTFDEAGLLASTNTFATGFFTTNRVISALNSNLPPTSVLQGHFILTSLHEYGTNVLMFGTGEYRASDVYLAMTPAAGFVSGNGTRYFAGLTNGQPTWSAAESNAVPVVQDNPTNGPPWPNDTPSIGNVSVIHPGNPGLWLMTYDGGPTPKTSGIYFSYAPMPWGPWARPQLIFNKQRDGGAGVFIHEPSLSTNDGLDGPVIGSNDPTNTPGGDFAPIMIERFTRITNSTLFLYYTMSTWNPYAVVKMRSAFTITPVIDAGSLSYAVGKGFSLSWNAPTNESFQVDYADALPPVWSSFTNVVTSTNGVFKFTDHGVRSGGLDGNKFYRVRTLP